MFFGNNNFKLYYDSSVVRTDTLSNGLYKINLDNVFEISINTIVRNKKKRKRLDDVFHALA